MSRAQILNTVRLMVGSEFQNLTPETLTVDPVITGPRIWFNSTELVIKFGYLDSGNNPIIVTLGDTGQVEQTLTDYVNSKISELGAAFSYRGQIDGGDDEVSAFDLATLYGVETPRAGDYYKNETGGWFVLDGVTKYANDGDGILMNASGGFDVIDNSNAEIAVAVGDESYLTISGSPDLGFNIGFATEFKTTLDTTFTKLANITNSVGLTVNGLIAANEFAGVPIITAATNVISALKMLAGEINNNHLGVVSAFTTLVDNLSSKTIRYESSVAALTHTIPHTFGLNAAVGYWVKDASDGEYYNDQVSVKLTATSVVLAAESAFDCLVFVTSKTAVVNPMPG